MTDRFDVAVVGLGAAGAAALSALAGAGVRAVGLDRFAPPHPFGSSHGETRLLRTAYSEGTAYVPMALRAIELWRALERRTGTSLFQQQGVFYSGPKDDAFLNSGRAAALAWNLPLTETGAPRQFQLPSHWQRFEETGGGFLLAEEAIGALLHDARRHGAEVITDCACSAIDTSGQPVVLRTSSRSVRADRVIVTVGAWIGAFLPDLSARTHVERRVVHWYRDEGREHASQSGFKPFFIAMPTGQQFYGFPANAAGEVKVAEHCAGTAIAGPDAVDRTITAADWAPVDDFTSRYLPGLGPRARSTVCLYPMSWDEHFILDRLPGDERIVVGAGLSGHGFKFAPVIGEALADLALRRTPKFDLSFFALSR